MSAGYLICKPETIVIMISVLADLRKDHQKIARLLVYMRSALNLVDDASARDEFVRLVDCLEFIGSYPDRVHHPREDVLYNILKERKEEFDRISVRLERAYIGLCANASGDLVRVLRHLRVCPIPGVDDSKSGR